MLYPLINKKQNKKKRYQIRTPSDKLSGIAYVPGPIVQSVAIQTAHGEIQGSGQSHTFMEFDHEIISKFFLLSLIQEGLLSATNKSMCTTKYWLTA